jgi:hypothetical protein
MRLIIHLQFWLHSFLFLLVFFNSLARTNLLGEVSHAHTADNLRRRGAAIVGFGACCSKAGSICLTSTKSIVIRTFWKIGPSNSDHQENDMYQRCFFDQFHNPQNQHRKSQ